MSYFSFSGLGLELGELRRRVTRIRQMASQDLNKRSAYTPVILKTVQLPLNEVNCTTLAAVDSGLGELRRLFHSSVP